MRWLVLCVTLSAATACSKGGSGEMAHLRIDGAVSIPEAELREGADGCEDARSCAFDVQNVYVQRGWLLVVVSPSRTRLQEWTGSRGGTLTIVEGPRFSFGSITIVEAGAHASTPLVDLSELPASGAIRAGSWFESEPVQAVMREVEARYRAAGYADAWVMTSTSIDMTANTVSIAFEVDRGATRPSPN